MGQRILMGILLSSGTISITQTVYYDQRCYMFYIGEGIINTVKTKSEKHLTNKKKRMKASKIMVLRLGKIGLRKHRFAM